MAHGPIARDRHVHAPQRRRARDRARLDPLERRGRGPSPRRLAARTDRSAPRRCRPAARGRRPHRRGHGPGLLHGPARRSRDREDDRVRDRSSRSSAWPRPMRSDRPRSRRAWPARKRSSSCLPAPTTITSRPPTRCPSSSRRARSPSRSPAARRSPWACRRISSARRPSDAARSALEGLPDALLALGSTVTGADAGDAATLVPGYVALPRGIAEPTEMDGRPTSAQGDASSRCGSTTSPPCTHRALPASLCRGRAYAFRQELETNRLAHYLVVRSASEIVAYGGIWLMVDEAHITTFAVLPDVAPARRRRPADARDDRARASTSGPGSSRWRCGSATRRRAGCTSASASGRSASGRATTRTTARTR